MVGEGTEGSFSALEGNRNSTEKTRVPVRGKRKVGTAHETIESEREPFVLEG